MIIMSMTRMIAATAAAANVFTFAFSSSLLSTILLLLPLLPRLLICSVLMFGACQNLEVCLGVSALALSVVMAGTGDLSTLKLLRGLRRRLLPVPTSNAASIGQNPAFSGCGGLSYGNHMAVSMALGFLFLGAGKMTFSRISPAIADLVLSLFMRFPQSPTDNRFHLQAFRHLYALGAEVSCVDFAATC